MGEATEEYRRIAVGNLPSDEGARLIRAVRMTQRMCSNLVARLISDDQPAIGSRSLAAGRRPSCTLTLVTASGETSQRAMSLESAPACLWLLGLQMGGRLSIVEESFAPEIGESIITSNYTAVLEGLVPTNLSLKIDAEATWSRQSRRPLLTSLRITQTE